MNEKALIEALNSLGVGEISRLEARLAEVWEEVRRAGHEGVAEILDQAAERLAACDLKGFRKSVHHAVSRLGHLKEDAARSLAKKLPPRLRR